MRRAIRDTVDMKRDPHDVVRLARVMRNEAQAVRENAVVMREIAATAARQAQTVRDNLRQAASLPSPISESKEHLE